MKYIFYFYLFVLKRQLTGWRPGTSATERASTSHSLMRSGSHFQSPSASREGISILSPSARRTASRARARKRISSKLGDNDAFLSHGKHNMKNLVFILLLQVKTEWL